ncbi:MAG: 50S ribosomal protein L20 [Candidatus Goldbacteria bacterium]|nr:50S ribosomal protein L20 [Candidatus Goldiibacteriota bacterium]
MPRVKRGVQTKRKHKKFIKLAKGFYGRKKNVYTRAMEQVMKGWQKSYIGRKEKKRTYRQLWIVRINAACRQNGISYSRFIDGLRKANIELNRKQLAELAVNDNNAFSKLVDIAKENVAIASN